MLDLFRLSEAEMRDKIFKLDFTEEQIEEVLEYRGKFPFMWAEVSMASVHPDAAGEPKQSGLFEPAAFPVGDLVAVSYTLRRLNIDEYLEALAKRQEEAAEIERELHVSFCFFWGGGGVAGRGREGCWRCHMLTFFP